MATKKMYLVREHVSASRYGLWIGVGVGEFRVVLACATQEKAIGEAVRLEAEARKVVPPFYVSQPHLWSSLWPDGLLLELEKIGLRDLPDPNLAEWNADRAWRLWWDRHGGALTQEQVEAIWKLLDRVEFYSVASVPVKG